VTVAALASMLVLNHTLWEDDQYSPGTGGAAAVALAGASPLVRSAMFLIFVSTWKIRGAELRHATVDAVANSRTPSSEPAARTWK
jgi:hypothetical protein